MVPPELDLELCQVVVPASVSLQAIVQSNNGGGTANNPKSEDVTLFVSNSEAIVTYKYRTLFCMKG